MSGLTSAPAGSAALDRPTLTNGVILRFFLPLAATSTMMSASVPIINAGLARLANVETNLAAFGLAFTLGIFLESPVFAIQQAVVAWYPGKGPIRPILGYAFGVGFVVFVYETLVAFSPAAPFLFERLMGATPELAVLATKVLKIAVVFPVLIAVRSALQAILIARRATAPVGWGTLTRLSALSAGIFLVAPRLPWDGPVSSMVCLAAGVLVELVYVAISVWRTPGVDGLTSPAQHAGRSVSRRTRFILPLMGMMALGTLTNPLINAFITRAGDPEAGLAAYAVVASLVWFLASPFLRFSAVTITLGTDTDSLRRLERFVWRAVAPLCAVLLLVHVTPLWRVLLKDVMGLTDDLTARVRLPLMLLSLQPFVAAGIAYHQGRLTRSARTWVVGLGGVSRVAAILIGGFFGLLLAMDGSLLGGVLLGLAFIGELAILLVLSRREAALGPESPSAPAPGSSSPEGPM